MNLPKTVYIADASDDFYTVENDMIEDGLDAGTKVGVYQLVEIKQANYGLVSVKKVKK